MEPNVREKERVFWERLFQLGPVRNPRAPSNLYEVIVDTADLHLAKAFVAGGHDPNQSFAGGRTLELACRHGNLEFIRFFIEQCEDINLGHSALSNVVERISESTDGDLSQAYQIFTYLLVQPFNYASRAAAYRMCATTRMVTAAKMMLESGLLDETIQVGYRKTRLLSEEVAGVDSDNFKKLLLKQEVDQGEMFDAEKLEQKMGAELKANLSSIRVSSDYDALEGKVYKEAYSKLINELKCGEWVDYYLSRDPYEYRTPVGFIAENGWTDMLNVILDDKSYDKKHQRSHYIEASILAASRGELEALKSLSAHGAVVKYKKKDCNSPISEACRYGHLDVVRYLLEQGADPASGDGSGHKFSLSDLAGGIDRQRIIDELNRFSKKSKAK